MANLRLSELDFDTIKANFKEFLKNYTGDDGAPYFTDFDFEGSGLSILLDVLSYNTHYNAYMSNMVINELFLDSAVKRESVVSIAKHLGYTPLSVRGAKALISFEVTDPSNSPAFLTLERFTPFTTKVNENQLTFVNLDAVTIQPDGGVYNFANVQITEGIPLQYTYTVSAPGPDEKYVIPNDNIDTSTIRVLVQNSYVDTTTTVYNLSEDTIGVAGDSKVFFLEENSVGKFQIYFGDGIVGKQLSRNNLVQITYLVSNGTLGNVSKNILQEFTCGETIGGGTASSVITASTNSIGGLEKESISSIRFRAPKFSSSQNRAVGAADYKSLIEKDYPLVKSVAVWGGEDNTPPLYGKVVISLQPYTGYEVTAETKNAIKNTVLQNKQMLTTMLEFVEPEYFYVNVSTTVKYNSKTTAYTATEVQSLVINAIQNYFTQDLQQFSKDFVYSKLSRIIDDTLPSIVGNLTQVRLQKRFEPQINANNLFVNDSAIKFQNGIEPGSLETTRFNVSIESTIYESKIKDYPLDSPPTDTGTGILSLVDADTNTVLIKNYGTINYGTGEITISNLRIVGYPANTSDLRLTIKTQDNYYDINVNRNQILLLDDSTADAAGNRQQGLTVNTVSVSE